MAAAALTPEQIYDVLIQAGWPTSHGAAIDGVAIALAESGGRPSATHLNANGTTDYGLFQINHAVEPDWDWQNPITNAQMALKIYLAHGFGRWATWNSGAYKLHLPMAQSGAAAYVKQFNNSQDPTGHYNWNPINDIQTAGRKGAAVAGGVVQSAADKLAPLAALASFLGNVGGKLGTRAFWVKVGIALIGVVLIVAGSIAFLKPAAQNVAGREVPV